MSNELMDTLESKVFSAVDTIESLRSEINGLRDERRVLEDKLRELTTVLGLTLEEPASKNGDLDESVIQGLLDQRAESRANRDFAAADRVRDELQAMGVAITDSPDGTSWSRI